jgi:hypothetical protein
MNMFVATRRHIVWRRIILLGTPALLILLELGHPALDHMHTISMLTPIYTWWIVLHILLVPLFALMGWSFFLLIEGIQNRAATLCRYATVVYMAFSIGYDTVAGLNSGVLVSNALSLPPTQQAIVQEMISRLFTSPAIILSFDLLLISGIATISLAAWALVRAGVPRLPALLLLGTILSAYSHALPLGPLGTACFFEAALWIELVWRKAQAGTPIPGDTVASSVA